MEEWNEQRMRVLIRQVCAEEKADLQEVIIWSRLQIAREKKRQEFWDTIMKSVIGHAILATGGFILIAIGVSIWERVKRELGIHGP